MKQKRWYLSTWFISLLFALWVLVIPPIVGIVLLIKEIKFEKRNRKEYFEKGLDQVENVQIKKASLHKEVEEKRTELDKLNEKKKDLKESIRKSEEQLGELDKGTDLKQKINHFQGEIDNLEKNHYCQKRRDCCPRRRSVIPIVWVLRTQVWVRII